MKRVLPGLLLLLLIRTSAAGELGTIGIGATQLYSDAQPNKRGVLVVRRVEPESAAAAAGIRIGDIVVSVNGSPVEGRDGNEIVRKDFKGPIGDAVRLSVAKLDGNRSEIVLTRKAYPPHLNPQSDPFSYVIPGSWQMDLRYRFPLPWSPVISYQGFEDLAFAPDFDDPSSPAYHSYLIVWWLDGARQLTAGELQTNMAAYFRGLAEQRGRNNHFAPDLSKISAAYNDSAQAPETFGGKPAKAFQGAVSIYDRRGNMIELHSEVTTSVCPANHTVVFFGMSREARPADIWTQLDAVRDTFHCSR